MHTHTDPYICIFGVRATWIFGKTGMHVVATTIVEQMAIFDVVMPKCYTIG